MAKGKSKGAGATKKSKPMAFAKTKDGEIGPKNRQDYGKGKTQKFSRGGMVKGC